MAPSFSQTHQSGEPVLLPWEKEAEQGAGMRVLPTFNGNFQGGEKCSPNI